VPYVFVASIAALTAFEMQRGDASDLLLAGVVALGLVVGRQVLSLRLALKAQRAETAFREAVLETQSELGLGMLIVQDGRIVFANGAAERISGLTSEQLQALPTIETLAFEHDRPEWREWLAQPLIPEETRIARPDGEMTEVEVVARRLQGRGESRVLIVARDVTARKQAADALAQAQKLEGLGALAGGVAHDFNNLLSSVLGNVGLLRTGELDGEASESVDSIESAALRGAELTRSLLEFARPQPPTFQVEDLRGCLQETAVLARSTLPVNVALHLETGATAAPVRGNKGQLVQAFLNLIINARDAIGEAGAISLRLGTRDDVATVEVIDTGTGMDAETQQRIFEPFFTTKGAGAGTGLGLAISHRTIRDHRGDLTVVSNPGEGTTFTVTLPLAALPKAS
jgi:PAS domain S-box-containing protein